MAVLRAVEDPAATIVQSLSTLPWTDQAAAVGAVFDEAERSIDTDLRIVAAMLKFCEEHHLLPRLRQDQQFAGKLDGFIVQVRLLEEREKRAQVVKERYLRSLRKHPGWEQFPDSLPDGMKRCQNGKDTFGNNLIVSWATLASQCTLNTALSLLRHEAGGLETRVTQRHLKACIEKTSASNSSKRRHDHSPAHSPRRSKRLELSHHDHDAQLSPYVEAATVSRRKRRRKQQSPPLGDSPEVSEDVRLPHPSTTFRPNLMMLGGRARSGAESPFRSRSSSRRASPRVSY